MYGPVRKKSKFLLAFHWGYKFLYIAASVYCRGPGLEANGGQYQLCPMGLMQWEMYTGLNREGPVPCYRTKSAVHARVTWSRK